MGTDLLSPEIASDRYGLERLLYGRVNKSEISAIKGLLDQDRPLTEKEIRDTRRHIEMSDEEFNMLLQANDSVGFPLEDEKLSRDLLTPEKALEYIEEDLSVSKSGVGGFNNEFALFTLARGLVPGDAIIDTNLHVPNSQFSPAKYRLRVIFPSLMKALEDYGSERERLTDFYKGLREDPKSLLLFTVADQLLQRLVRPRDKQYINECVRASQLAGGGSFIPPRYDEVLFSVNKGDKAIYYTRPHLWT